MAIAFNNDQAQEERIVTSTFTHEDEAEFSLRPKTMRDYVGQEKVKENLSIFIQAAKGRGDQLDHVLLYGPPGLGKTTLAGIIAAEIIQTREEIKIIHGVININGGKLFHVG